MAPAGTGPIGPDGTPLRDPGACPHERHLRIGDQEIPFPPFKVHLVTCLDCGTTLTVETLRGERVPPEA